MAVLEQAAELELEGEMSSRSRPAPARGSPRSSSTWRRMMPEGPFMFAPRTASDQPLERCLAELIREAVIRRTFQEVPHAVEVIVEEIEPPREGLTRVRALIWVESESQKGILIGARGRMIKAIGTAARRELERELGSQVHLDLSCAFAATGAPTSPCSTASASPSRFQARGFR